MFLALFQWANKYSIKINRIDQISLFVCEMNRKQTNIQLHRLTILFIFYFYIYHIEIEYEMRLILFYETFYSSIKF